MFNYGFSLNEEQLAVKWSGILSPTDYSNAKQWDLEKNFPGRLEENGRRLSAQRFWEYEGSGMDFISHAIVAEELGYGCSSCAAVIRLISPRSQDYFKVGTEEQKQNIFPYRPG